MLPAHLRTTTTRSSYRDVDETNAGGRLRQPPPPPPSLCVTGAMCQQGNCRIERQRTTSDNDKADSKSETDKTLNETATIAYRIFRPRQLLRTPCPLVVLHGGPSIPSTYLLPLVNTICDRAIVLYDQWGCGKSSRPTPTTTNAAASPPSHAFPPLDIQVLVDDLHYLITKEWKLQSFHLYGHSFGGILAYEYLKKYKPSHCQSLILASTPTSTALVESEMIRLKQELLSLQPSSATTKNDDNDNDEEDDGDDEDDEYRHHLTKINHHPSSLLSSLSDPLGGGSGCGAGAGASSSGRPNKGSLSRRQNRQETLFFETHHCRVSNPVPLVLQDALASAGPIPWRGMAAIPNYQATAIVAENMDGNANFTRSGIGFPPTLLLKGEFDFVTRVCMEQWYDLLQPPRDDSTNPTAVVQDLVSVPNCSHYGMLEDEQAYGKILGGFFLRHDL
jgi:proline-specific peptidase